MGIRPVQLMIVKNEAGRIRKALSWGEDLFEQRIVVDTGSLDRTAEIAKSLGAVVHQIDWEDDFSRARNEALRYCPDGWVIFTDADEYMSEDDAKKVPGILEEAEKSHCNAVDAALLHVDDSSKVQKGGSVTCIFRKQGDDIYYRRRVHEQLECRTGLYVFDATDDISVLHAGFRVSEQNTDRDMTLMQKELIQNPEDCEMLGFLGDEYYRKGDAAKAEALYKSSIACMKEPSAGYDPRAVRTFNCLLEILGKKKGGEAEFYEYYQKATETFPTEPDFDYLLASYLDYTGDDMRTAEMYERALVKYQAFGNDVQGVRTAAALPQIYETIARCCSRIGDYASGERAARQLLSQQKDHYKTLVYCMICQKGLCESGEHTLDECVKVLDLYYERHSLKDQMLLYRASCDAEFEDLRLRLYGRFTPEQQSSLDFLFPVTGVDAQ